MMVMAADPPQPPMLRAILRTMVHRTSESSGKDQVGWLECFGTYVREPETRPRDGGMRRCGRRIRGRTRLCGWPGGP